VSFLGAEACLLAGSARNAYHTKYRGIFGGADLSCATLRKGVFAAGAALALLSMIGSIFYYWTHSKADTGGWEKHNSEGVGMTTSHFMENQQQTKDNQFEKLHKHGLCSFILEQHIALGEDEDVIAFAQGLSCKGLQVTAFAFSTPPRTKRRIAKNARYFMVLDDLELFVNERGRWMKWDLAIVSIYRGMPVSILST
ncbi:hypothetical protein ACH5RR_036219, partial [Cinchona calisaya]